MRSVKALVGNRAAGLAMLLGLSAAVAALATLAGCAVVAVGQVEPALFPAAAAASAPPLAARLALVLPPAVREQTHPGPGVPGAPSSMSLPLGAIVDAALQRQLAVAFAGGARSAALPLPADTSAELALSVSEMRLVFDRRLNWVVPIPVPAVILFVVPLASSTDYSARLELDLRVSDALGRQLAQTTVDSGTVVLERGQWTSETPLQLYQKLTHQAAWQAAAKAAEVMREALHTERQRERPL